MKKNDALSFHYARVQITFQKITAATCSYINERAIKIGLKFLISSDGFLLKENSALSFSLNKRKHIPWVPPAPLENLHICV